MNDIATIPGIVVPEMGPLKVIITTTSGSELEVEQVCLWPKAELDKMGSTLQLASKQGQGFSTGLGFIGGLGSVVTSSLLLGAVEGAISNSMQKSADQNVSIAAGWLKLANERACFIPVPGIHNIQDPDPSSWWAEYVEPERNKRQIYIHNGSSFIRARSIPKCNIPQKEWMHGKPLHTSELRGTSNDPGEVGVGVQASGDRPRLEPRGLDHQAGA